MQLSCLSKKMNNIRYNNSNIRVLDEADFIVVGGGVAGSVAAISALKEGKSSIIIEKTNALGGSATNSLVIPFMNSYVAKDNGLNASLNKEYQSFDKNVGLRNNDKILFANPISFEMFYDFKIRDLGGKIYYDSTFIDAIKENNIIKYIIVYVHNELVAFKGKCFADCSGEGLLAFSVGATLMHGNEARNNIHQALSLRFEMGGIDKIKLVNWLKSIGYKGFGIPNDPNEIEFIRDASYENIILKAIENKEVTLTDVRSIQCFKVPGKPNTFSFNGPQISELANPDKATDYSMCVSKCYEAINRYHRFFINHIPGFENAYISNIASQLGIRESIRVKTLYVLKNDDYTKRARFIDGIAKADWYVDIHTDDPSLMNDEPYKPYEYYEIPYRSLIIKEADNLIIGGRIIGTSFRVEASVRIQVTLRDVSEVIGKAVSYSIDNDIALNHIDGAIFKVK